MIMSQSVRLSGTTLKNLLRKETDLKKILMNILQKIYSLFHLKPVGVK